MRSHGHSGGSAVKRRRERNGFSAVELSISLAISALIIPIIYRYASVQDDATALAIWHIQTSGQVETVAEELRLDARRGAWDSAGLAFTGGPCPASYQLTDDHVLVRVADQACGGRRALASGVSSIIGAETGVEIEFRRQLRPDVAHTTTVFLPVVPK